MTFQVPTNDLNSLHNSASQNHRVVFPTRTFPSLRRSICSCARNISNNQAYRRILPRFQEFYLYHVNERSRWAANLTLIERERQFPSCRTVIR